MVKSITLHISQSASALHEHPSSHFLSSSHSLKFLNWRSSRLIVVKSSAHDADCYPLCHMKTSSSVVATSDLRDCSSSNVTIFSDRGR